MDKKKQLGFYLDISSCVGCKTCETACKDKNDLPLDVRWRRVKEHSSGSWLSEEDDFVPSGVYAYHLSISCQHCESPPCMAGCPVFAISKDDDGIVNVDRGKCIGCQTCFSECPYDAPQFASDGDKMSKCDMCADLRAKDENPACIETCPLRALEWGDMDELRAKYGNITAVAPLPDGSITGPSMILTPHRNAQIK